MRRDLISSHGIWDLGFGICAETLPEVSPRVDAARSEDRRAVYVCFLLDSGSRYVSVPQSACGFYRKHNGTAFENHSIEIERLFSWKCGRARGVTFLCDVVGVW